MKYRFKRPHRQYRTGDTVPDGLDAGSISTMLTHNVIEKVDEPKAVFVAADAYEKSIDAPPADKSMATFPRREKVRSK